MNRKLIFVFVLLVVCAFSICAQTEQTSNQQTTISQFSNKKATAETTVAESSAARQIIDDDELPRFEIGAQFSSLNRDFDNRNGFGGRFTYNINRYVAAEAETNFYPGETFEGRGVQFVAGIKAGKRFSKFGIFGKARPGFLYLSQGKNEFSGTDITNFNVRRVGRTDFALDLGGVLEFYPTKNIITRFDAGDTIVRSGSQKFVAFFDQNGKPTFFSFSGSTRQYFQFTAGIGFRF